MSLFFVIVVVVVDPFLVDIIFVIFHHYCHCCYYSCGNFLHRCGLYRKVFAVRVAERKSRLFAISAVTISFFAI